MEIWYILYCSHWNEKTYIKDIKSIIMYGCNQVESSFSRNAWTQNWLNKDLKPSINSKKSNTNSIQLKLEFKFELKLNWLNRILNVCNVWNIENITVITISEKYNKLTIHHSIHSSIPISWLGSTWRERIVYLSRV